MVWKTEDGTDASSRNPMNSGSKVNGMTLERSGLVARCRGELDRSGFVVGEVDPDQTRPTSLPPGRESEPGKHDPAGHGRHGQELHGQQRELRPPLDRPRRSRGRHQSDTAAAMDAVITSIESSS